MLRYASAWVELFRVREESCIAVHHPLAHHEVRPYWNLVATEFKVADRLASHGPSRRVEPHGFLDHASAHVKEGKSRDLGARPASTRSTSSCSSCCAQEFWPSKYHAHESARAVVSWPARRNSSPHRGVEGRSFGLPSSSRASISVESRSSASDPCSLRRWMIL